MLSLAAFLIVLSVLVLVHEFGHFITAKRIGVKVERFSMGFGPKLWSIKRGGTEYMISAIPLGGYVKMAGDEPWEKLKGAKWEFLSRSVGDRFWIIFAGPFLNYMLAFLLFSVIFMFGSPTTTTEVGGLMKDYPAARQGLAVGDKIIAVDGKSVKYWEDMTALIHKHSEGSITLTVERLGTTFDKEIKPAVRRTKDIFGSEVSIALIGVTPSQKIESVRYGFFQSLYMGGKKLLQLTAITYKALWSIITGRLSVKESLTGPIGIFVVTGQAAKMGFIYILHLMAILSASLAMFNILPLPILDGGHILFLGIEKLRGKPLSLKAQEAIANIGVTLLIMLTIFIFYSDIVKFGLFDKVAKIFRR
ncbi:MAG: RIP metalloprotease RseP [Candidatus Omnitrophica bacterium]|nr:RIP metalloprotease RseP [Candidatus Omnitrophota bacterium]